MHQATPGQRSRQLWLIGLACLTVTLWFYASTLHIAFVGDDLAYVRPNPNWLRDALLPGVTWQYRPLPQLLLRALSTLGGLRPEVLHLLNLSIHAGIGVGLALWLRQVGMEPRVWTIAPLIFVSRGIGYEVLVWPSDLSYLLVVALTLITLSSWDHYLRGRGNRYRVWTLVGFTLAILSSEVALVLLPLYLLYDLIVHPEKSLWLHLPVTGERRRGGVREYGPLLLKDSLRYLPFVLVVVGFLGAKVAHHHTLFLTSYVAESAPAPAPVPSGMELAGRMPADRTWFGMFNTPRRALLDLLLGATYLFLPITTSFSNQDSMLTRHAALVLLPWLALHVWVFWKGQPVTRFLLAWVYLYLLPVAVASVPSSRYFYVSTVPAASLVAVAFVTVWKWLERRVHDKLIAPAAVALVALLVYGESSFVHARMEEWRQGSDLMKNALATLERELGPDVRRVYLFNLPRNVPGPYPSGVVFGNAADYLAVMLHRPRQDVAVIPVYDRPFVGGTWPTIGKYMTRVELREGLREPESLAYEFALAPPRIVRLY